MKTNHFSSVSWYRKFRKAIFLLLTITMSAGILKAQYGQPVDSVEAEDGVLSGVYKSTSIKGYSGSGYVTGFDNSSDKVTVTVQIPERGMYKIVIRYNAPNGEKTQNLSVNGGFSSPVVFPATSTYESIDAGNFLMEQGDNTITVQSSWGWMDIDKFTVYAAAKNTYNISDTLVDPEADSATIALYQYLVSNYGKKIISGQTDSYYEDLADITGINPMFRAGDMQSYTVGYPYLWVNGGHTFGWNDSHQSEKLIDWYKSTGGKGIVGFQWHWHSPFGGEAGTNTFYTNQTTFDVTKAVQDGTPENIAILRDIDSIATQLKKFQDAGIPVLWRPLHEAGGGWFWWGAKGPEACKALYHIIYDRLQNYHHLHNLIWVWSTPEADWYPGNDYVDIIGYDSYPGDYNYGTQKTMFDKLNEMVSGEKIVTMSENGPIPNPDDCLTLDAPWSYFMSWNDLVSSQNSVKHLLDVYSDTNVLTLGYINPAVLRIPVDTIYLEADTNSSASFTVYSNMSWTATSDQSWLTVDPGSDSSVAVVTVTAAENYNGTRKAAVTISGTGTENQIVTISQASFPARELAVSIDSLIIEAGANSTQSFTITSNTSWTVSCSASWLTLSADSGSENATITLTAEENNDIEREALITVSAEGLQDQTIVVTQESGVTAAYLNENAGKCLVFPNPNHGKFNISLNQLTGDENAVVNIVNPLGTMVKTFEISGFVTSFQKEINLDGEPAGLYFLTLKTGSASFVTKFLIH